MYRASFAGRFEHIVFPREEKRRLSVNLGPLHSSAVPIDHSSAVWPKNDWIFVRWLLAQAGLNADLYRSETLQRRLPACLRSLRAQSSVHATELLAQSPALIPATISTLLIGVTSFFRDPLVFDQLRNEISRDFGESGQGVNAWSIGCSDGAEMYSFAMLLADLGILQNSYLIGTDCRAQAIEEAKSGIYDAPAMRQVPTEFHERYFLRNGKCCQVSVILRQSARWRVANVLNEIEPGQWDIIFFRNTALYLKPEVLELLWPRIEAALRPGGLLLLGRAERPTAVHRLRAIGPCLYRRHPR